MFIIRFNTINKTQAYLTVTWPGVMILGSFGRTAGRTFGGSMFLFREAPKSLVVAGLVLFPMLVNAQGFGGLGGFKKAREAELTRMLPASVNLNEKRIKVVALEAASNIPKDLVAILRTKWVTAVQKDPRFILDERNPETELRFTITNYYVEGNTFAGASGVPPCTFFTGKIEASYQAVDPGTEATLDSENLSYAVTQEGVRSTGGPLGGLRSSRGGCGTGGKTSQNEARDALVDGLVAEMSQRATPFEETLTVPVPGSKLEPLSALAESQRWAKLLEDAEKTDPLPKPGDDAYRAYLIGLANEALAYQDAKDASELEKARRGDVTSDKAKQSLAQEEKDFNEAQAYLDKAAKAYKDAIQAKPSEKEFRDPDARIEEAVRLYTTINRHKAEYQEAVAKKAAEREKTAVAAGSRSAGAGGASGVAGGSTLDRVIGMCQDHVPDIGQLIKDHPDEIHFERGLTLGEELRVKKECGGESKAIMDSIKAEIPASKPPAISNTPAVKPATVKPATVKK